MNPATGCQRRSSFAYSLSLIAHIALVCLVGRHVPGRHRTSRPIAASRSASAA